MVIEMKLRRWHLYAYASLCFILAFTTLNLKYDRFYRVNGINNDNRALIEQYLDDEEHCDYGIKHTDELNEYVNHMMQRMNKTIKLNLLTKSIYTL